MSVKERVLVVAAHPDDELLGCAGTIAWHIERGDEVAVMIMAEGITSRGTEYDSDNQLDDLKRQAHKAAGILGQDGSLDFCSLPDNRMDSVDLLDIVQLVEKKIAEFQPTTVYTHHSGDLNIDHRLTHEAVLTASRPMPGSCVRNIYAFETVSSTEWGIADMANRFTPARYVDISPYIDKKLDALACYKGEMREYPHARSLVNVKSLAAVRGATVGWEYAEAFVVIREICA